MPITVNTNIYSLSAQRNITRTQLKMQTAIQRLSSGLRINQAKDDAAGLGMAQYMEGQARGAAVAQRTIADGTSLLQVADNTLRTANEMLQRMRELAVQYNSGTYSSAQQGYMSTEFTALKTELGALAGRAKFNGQDVFSGTAKNIQVGANSADTIAVTTGSFPTITGTISNIANIETDMNSIASATATIGAYQSRLEKAGNVAAAIEEAQWASYGRVMDADMARETARLTSAQVTQQAGAAALAQANGIPQIALGLL